MSAWLWILGASAIAYLTKLVGYLVPRAWLDRPWVRDVSHSLTAGLLASLVVMNTFLSGQRVVVDARLAALAAAALALWLRAPFLLVVVIGGAAAALVRLAGF